VKLIKGDKKDVSILDAIAASCEDTPSFAEIGYRDLRRMQAVLTMNKNVIYNERIDEIIELKCAKGG
jgi:hypothetical protein